MHLLSKLPWILCLLLAVSLAYNKCNPTRIVSESLVVDTLYQKGATVFLNRVIYREVDPEVIYITEYETSPITIDFVSARITESNLFLEYLVNDSLHSATMAVELPEYGDTHVTINEDSTVVVQTQRLGFYPELIGGVSITGVYAGFDLWYYNLGFLPTTLHYPVIALEYPVFSPSEYLIPRVGVNLDIHTRTPLRVGIHSIWDNGIGFSAGLELPLWQFKK